jgi:hypothetical protein
MRPVWVVFAFLGCGGNTTARPAPSGPAKVDNGMFAEEALFQPAYSKAELERALIAERGAEAKEERILTELEAKDAAEDRLRVARADLAVRRRFIQSLEACQTSGQACPPRLDDPPWAFDPDPDSPLAPKIDTPLRFDLETWQKIAREMHGRACACRTISCVESVSVAIDQLEAKPTLEVQGDYGASESIMWARECLFRLRGKKPTLGLPEPREPG